MAEQENGGSQAATKPDAGALRSRPTKTLPTDRIQFQKQLDLLRAYAAVSGPSLKPVTNKDVAGVVGMVPSTVSISNRFFSEMGFLTQAPNGGYIPAGDVVSYARAYEWNPDAASHKLAPTVLATWFAQRLVPKLRFRAMSEGEAISDLADEASAGPAYQGQLEMLLDYMDAAGVVILDGGQVTLGPQASASPTASESSPVAPEQQRETSPKTSAVATTFSAPTQGVVQFHVSVKVDMAEFSNWQSDRIAAFFSGIAQVLAAKGRLEEGASGS